MVPPAFSAGSVVITASRLHEIDMTIQAASTPASVVFMQVPPCVVHARKTPETAMRGAGLERAGLSARDRTLTARLSSPLASLYRTHLGRHFEQRRIELHERVIDRAVLRVARITTLGRRQCGDVGLHVATEIEKRPFGREPRLIFDERFEPDEIGLKTSTFVDGTLGCRPANLENQRCLVRPTARLHERAI